MCLMALSLAPDSDSYQMREVSNRTEQYVLSGARTDGSFGTLYTTALALQVIHSASFMMLFCVVYSSEMYFSQ